jgi:hypothetical protein
MARDGVLFRFFMVSCGRIPPPAAIFVRRSQKLMFQLKINDNYNGMGIAGPCS